LSFSSIPGSSDRNPNCQTDPDPDRQVIRNYSNRDPDTDPDHQTNTDFFLGRLFQLVLLATLPKSFFVDF
jgi:hypothetical protein